MNDYVHALEAELVRAGRERRRRRRLLSGLARVFPRAGANAGFALLAAGSTVVVVAVVVVALAGHGRSSGDRAGAGNGPGASALIAKLAVLRRPQTAADRTLPRVFVAMAPPGPRVPSLTRLVATLPGMQVFMVVNRPAGAAPGGGVPLWSPRLGDQVAIVAVTGNNRAPIEGPGVPAADLANAQDRPIPIIRTAADGHRPHDVVEIVPDGVARVRLQLSTLTGRRLPPLYPAVANNLVIVRVPTARRSPVTTWYAPDGHVIPSSSEALQHATAQVQSAERALFIKRVEHSTNRAAPGLLNRFAIFNSSSVGPTGGISVSRQPLTSLPLGVLQLADPSAQLDYSQTRLITTLSGVRLWFTPGARSACIATISGPVAAGPSSSSGTCASGLAALESKGMWTNERLHDGTNVLVGIVPDTNNTVTAVLKGGATRTVPVVDGVVITPSAGVTTIRVRGVSGKVTALRENGR